MNIRPSDIDLLSRVFQVFDSAPVAFFENVPPDRIAQLKNAARGLPVKLRFGSGSSTSIETLAFGFACNYALSRKDFSRQEKDTICAYRDALQSELLLNHPDM